MSRGNRNAQQPKARVPEDFGVTAQVDVRDLKTGHSFAEARRKKLRPANAPWGPRWHHRSTLWGLVRQGMPEVRD